MKEEQLAVLIDIHYGLGYFINFIKLLAFLFGVRYYMKFKSRVYKTVVLFLGADFLLWAIKTLVLHDIPSENILEISYFEYVSTVIKLSVIAYLFLYCLKQAKLSRKVFSILVLINFCLIIYDVIEKKNKTDIGYIPYSFLMAEVLIVAMSVSYLLHVLSKKTNENIKFVALGLLFLAYYSLGAVYSSTMNFFINIVEDNEEVFLMAMSKIVFDAFFYILLFLFVTRIKKRHGYII